MNLDELLKSAQFWYDSLTPEEQLDHDADQAVSYAYHCAKSLRKKGVTYDEFIATYGPTLKQLYLSRHSK
jgi:hypothetical protein